MIQFEARGLDDAIAYYQALPGRLSTRLRAALMERAEAAKRRLVPATNVDTGKARDSWMVDDNRGPDEVAVVNTARSPEGFPYPSALITGTGDRGAPTPGYDGAFAVVPGMLPSATLRPAWIAEVSEPLATPQLLGTLRT